MASDHGGGLSEPRGWDWQIRGREPLFRDAHIKWGHEAQQAKAVEELNELAAELARDANDQADLDAILTEIVDVRIMLEQLSLHITDEALEDRAAERLARLEIMVRGEEAVDE